MKVVLPLDDAAADLAAVGGKGASLARMARAGLPVPRGFHVTTAAYRAFVASFRDEIDPADPEHAQALFARHDVPTPVAEEIRLAYAALGGDVAVAVRSSATAEDLPELSFAGQQDTYLNIRGDSLLDAVKRCWASLWNPRAVTYRDQHGIAHDDLALAVVVQELVDADAAGILFTADPVTGVRDRAVINASWGLGDAVVAGRVTPDTVVVSAGVVTQSTIGDKAVMTVRTATGSEDRPTPDALRGRPVLDEKQAVELAALGSGVQKLHGVPVDVEWARRDGTFWIVQARPITGLSAQVEEWNDSRKGDYLWTAGNFGEAIPDVMTPITWSFVPAVHPRGHVRLGHARLRHGGQHRWPLLHEPQPHLRHHHGIARAEPAERGRGRLRQGAARPRHPEGEDLPTWGSSRRPSPRRSASGSAPGLGRVCARS